MDVPAYLARINYHGSLSPSADVLRDLQRAHMFTVPFENLDIHIPREIVCNEDRFIHKVVNEHRGGFCYELNGAFAALLRALGFSVTLLSARVPCADGSDGPEFDHLTLRVDLDEPWLADVGFGDSFLEPLRLQSGLEQPQGDRVYRIVAAGDVLRCEVKDGPAWKLEYLFTLKPRQLPEFAEMCRYHQTSPESPFTRKRVCSRATPEGRITLSNGKLIETRNGQRQERALSDEEWKSKLQELFGVICPGELSNVSRLETQAIPPSLRS
jgi:N-hydroxyarylamine O-acetyltransferase